MTKARGIADIVGDLGNNAGKAIVVNDAGTELEYGVAGGEVTSTDDAYKNYNTVSSDATLTLESNKNFFFSWRYNSCKQCDLDYCWKWCINNRIGDKNYG